MRRIFLLTGPPRTGKTTAFLRVIELIKRDGFNVGGMFTSEIARGLERIGFGITDISTGETGELASIGNAEGPRLGKYRVNLRDIERIGVRAVRSAIERSDIVAIDEIGPMELLSPDFRDAVEDAIRGQKVVLATIHFRARGPVLDKVRDHPDSMTWEVTARDRERLPALLYNEMKEALRRRGAESIS